MTSPSHRSKSFDFSGFTSANHHSEVSSNRQRLLERLMETNEHLKKNYSKTHQRNKTIAYHENQEDYSTDANDKNSNNQTTKKQDIQSRILKYKTNFDRIEQDQEQYKQKRTLKLPYLKKGKNKKYYFNRYAKLNETQESILLNYLNAKFSGKVKYRKNTKYGRNSDQDLLRAVNKSKQHGKLIKLQIKKDKTSNNNISPSRQRVFLASLPKQNKELQENVIIIHQNQKYEGKHPNNYSMTEQYKFNKKIKGKQRKDWKKMGLINLYKVDKKGDISKIDIIAPVQVEQAKYYQKTCDPKLHSQSGHCSHQHNHRCCSISQIQKSNKNSRLKNYENFSPQHLKTRISKSVNKLYNHHYIKDQNSNREWQQINPFNLITYYAKKKDNNSPQNSYPATSMMKIRDFVKLPSNDQLSEFIQNYHPVNGDIQIYKLIKEPCFQVQFQQDVQLFFGETLKGKKHGNGVLLKKHYIFEGEFKNDLKNKGIEITDIGMYNGSFLNQQRDGYGQFKWNNGQYYNGEWKKGKKHGSGMWSSKKGDTYIGEWNLGKVQGQGVHTTANKQKYQGDFVNFLKHGWGKQFLPNGDTYQGNFYQGTPHGKGRYTWKQGDVYEGQFLKSFRTGIGILKLRSGITYQGHFNQQNPQGLCQIQYNNGDIYKGVFKNGKKNGRGTLKRKRQKQVWDGFWKNDEFVESVN